MLDAVLEHQPETKAGTAPGLRLRVAVATKEGARVDLHFGHAEVFSVYDVDAQGARLVAARAIAEHALNEDEDPRQTIYRMIADCQVLLVAKVGAAPQEALAQIGVEATNFYAGKSVDEALAELYAAKKAAAEDATLDAGEFALMHAMLRVADLDRSIAFYTQQLGMRVLERREHKKNQFSQAYLGYAAGFGGMTLELVQNWQREEAYVAGDAFGHIAIQVNDIMRLCDRLAAAGVSMPRPPRAQRHGENIVAFIADPDGYRIELVQAPQPDQTAALEEAKQL
ncbi:lactoylglutathione lyase [Rhodoblastus acidophilus]|uniref:Aldoketomutase n=1 Tax=Rhodoblastus acidophilus TaxID=1074 RepID=A0A212RBM8_RHOAC|nr:lactoylglutathione lyase [Rhodoblastus acidophilus]PPQ39401.1 lactoylglutathione lyase [Rhodoblastus acidophilus]RAI19421.1 lactoylglutathione lyase [Rhodoblastus acidophilus]SNB69573.1 lactoylglutathione lyase [Rhodoblastus acidophilus]